MPNTKIHGFVGDDRKELNTDIPTPYHGIKRYIICYCIVISRDNRYSENKNSMK